LLSLQRNWIYISLAAFPTQGLSPEAPDFGGLEPALALAGLTAAALGILAWNVRRIEAS
jgi:hypothetical protein